MQRWLTRISPHHGGSKTRRAAFGGLIYLLLGVVTTVGVAWGLAWSPAILSAPPERSGATVSLFHESGLPQRGQHVRVWRSIGCEWVRIEKGELWNAQGHLRVLDVFASSEEFFSEEGEPRDMGPVTTGAEFQRSAMDVIPQWCRGILRFDSSPETKRRERELVANGWPRLALYRDLGDCKRDYFLGRTFRLILGSNPNANTRLLPQRPIWPGFLIDTLFYAALWFGMIFGFGAARRGLRKKPGRCPMCGYDLRGDLDAGCPECGWGREE